MSNTIIIELCKEDRQRLDELIAFAGLIVGEMKSKPAEVRMEAPAHKITQAEDGTVKLVKNDHPVDADLPWETPEPAAEPEQPKYTHDDVLALVQKMAVPGSNKRLQAKAIITSYAAKVSDIPADKLGEAMAKLQELHQAEG